MRLNGKAAIMHYLGKDKRNYGHWVAAKVRYAEVIYILDPAAHRPRYWTKTEWLDRVDVELGKPIKDTDYSGLVATRDTRRLRYMEARARMAA